MKLQQFGSSLSLPDRVLTFVRDHPLMDRPVFPADGRPLLVTTDTAYLRVVAHRVTSLSGKEYDVLYLGTGIFKHLASCPYSVYRHLREVPCDIQAPEFQAQSQLVHFLALSLPPRGWTPPPGCAHRSSAQCPGGSDLVPRTTAG